MAVPNPPARASRQARRGWRKRMAGSHRRPLGFDHGDGVALRAGPAVFLHLAGALDELVAPALVGGLVVEREIEREAAIQVGPAEVEAGADHADFVTHLEAAPAGQEVRALLVAGDFVGEEIIDDDRLAPRIEQALAAEIG